MERRKPLARRTPLRSRASLPRGGGLSRYQRLPRQSTKQAGKERSYLAERKRYLTDHAACEVRWDGTCTYRATQVHHICPRSKCPDLIDDPRNFKAVCDYCHAMIHKYPRTAREEGHLR